MTTKLATHYRVVCSCCGKDGEVCPQRQTDLDVWLRAVRPFERAGFNIAPTQPIAVIRVLQEGLHEHRRASTVPRRSRRRRGAPAATRGCMGGSGLGCGEGFDACDETEPEGPIVAPSVSIAAWV